MIKKIIYAFLLCAFLVYGYFLGARKIFPLPQMLELKHYVEYSRGTFEDRKQVKPAGSAEAYNTFLERLLIKKIPIKNFNGYGGGLSVSGNMLYIITNKGSVQTYNLNNYTEVKNDITSVPMNLKEFILSGHPYENHFQIVRFRVNGVHSEFIDGKTQVLFIAHNAYDSKRDCITQDISRTTLEINTDGSVSQKNKWNTIFTASPCIDILSDQEVKGFSTYPGHISGGIISSFDKDHLLVTMGDYDKNGIINEDEWAMDPSTPFGKFILVNKQTGKWSVYASGSRNATGLYIDKKSIIWSVENGPQGGDELNIVKKGENYGWPKVSYGLWYDPTYKLPGGFKSGSYPEYKKPVFSWVPSVAPRGLTKIEGDKFKYWKGDLIMGTMRDQSLHRLRLDQNNRVVYDERIYLGHRVRDLTTLPDGRIALMTDDGYLMIIDDGGGVFNKMDSKTKERMAALDNFDQFAGEDNSSMLKIAESSSKTVFQQRCSSCHNLNQVNEIGPNLHNLFTRQVGSVDNFQYSTALKTAKRTWNAQLLRTFLKDPKGLFPGTQMQKINLSSSEIDSLVQLFQQQHQNNSEKLSQSKP